MQLEMQRPNKRLKLTKREGLAGAACVRLSSLGRVSQLNHGVRQTNGDRLRTDGYGIGGLA